MALLRFIHPSRRPMYGFHDIGAEIVLSAAEMRDVYADYLKKYPLKQETSRQPTPRQLEFKRVSELLALLTEACAAGTDVSLDGDDYVGAFCSDLMFTKRFVSINCPKCAQRFLPEECQVLTWSIGEGLCGVAGRRVICPAKHTVYSCSEWDA